MNYEKLTDAQKEAFWDRFAEKHQDQLLMFEAIMKNGMPEDMYDLV